MNIWSIFTESFISTKPLRRRVRKKYTNVFLLFNCKTFNSRSLWLSDIDYLNVHETIIETVINSPTQRSLCLTPPQLLRRRRGLWTFNATLWRSDLSLKCKYLIRLKVQSTLSEPEPKVVDNLHLNFHRRMVRSGNLSWILSGCSMYSPTGAHTVHWTALFTATMLLKTSYSL